MMTALEKNTLFFLGRQFCYLGGLILCAVSLWYGADMYHSDFFEEYGIVENLEVVLLLLTGLIFGIFAVCYKKHRILSFSLMSLLLLAACRELDAFFDDIFPVLGWKFAFIFPAGMGLFSLFHFKSFRTSLIQFINSPTFYLMMTAMIVIVPVAQTIGHKSFIAAITGTIENVRPLRRLFEESIELEGYFLLFFSLIEYYFSLLRPTKK